MTRPHHTIAFTASRSEMRGGVVSADSGIAPGLVVVDSNRPCLVAGIRAAAARGLLKQPGAAL
jgi:hypothetical protein